MRISPIAILVTLTAGCAMAQSSPAPTPATQPAPPGNATGAGGALSIASPVAAILDALDARGRDLRSFTADVSLSESDTAVGDTNTRTGKVVYQLKPDGGARIRVTFDTLKSGEGRPVKEKLIYMLDDGKLIDRSYRKSSQTTRQVTKPGEKINLLKLGEGPFPLPIGQPKEEVFKQFDVTKIEPAKDDPPGTVHVRLVPKAGTNFARQFKTIDVWVDLKSDMPRRIDTIDASETTLRTTELTDVQVNPVVADSEFKLESIDVQKWNIVEEQFQN